VLLLKQTTLSDRTGWDGKRNRQEKGDGQWWWRWRKNIINDEMGEDSLSYDKLFPRVAPEEELQLLI
jgi:hypothetical protein